MFLTGLSKPILDNFAHFQTNILFLQTLAQLQKGAYRILYRYDSEQQRLIYEAFQSEKGPGDYLAFSVDSSRRLLPYPEGSYLDEKALAFADYLYQKESHLSQESLKAIYAPYREELEPLLNLTPYEIEKRQRVREEFLQSVAFIEQDSKAKDNSASFIAGEKLALVPSFQSLRNYAGDEGFREIHLKLHLLGKDNEKYPLNDLSAFVSAYHSGGSILIKKPRASLTLKLTSDLFSERDIGLLNFLWEHHGGDKTAYWLKKDTLVLSPFEAMDAFALYEGTSLSFNNETYQVYSSHEQAGLFLSPEGGLTFFPPLSRLDNVIASRDGLALFDPFKKRIDLFSFPNEPIGELYSFFLVHGEESYPLVKDIIEKRLVPHLGKNLTLSALPKQEQASALLTIEYYVDLSEEDHLLFHTLYKVGGVAKDPASLSGNLYYTSLLYLFHNVLEEMRLPEEGEIQDEESVLSFLRSDLTKLKKAATLLLSDRLKAVHLSKLGKINLSLSSHLDFLSLRASCPDYSEEELAGILASYRKKRRYYKMNEEWILLDDPSLEKLDAVAQEMALDPQSLKRDALPFYEALKLASTHDKALGLGMDDYLAKAINDIKAFKNAPLALAPELMSAMRPYQKDATKWMNVLRQYHLSGILADDMGMGKTLESIAFLSLVSEEAPILIVAPKSVLYNWEAEFANGSLLCGWSF